MKTNIDNVTPFSLSALNSFTIARECSATHIGNVIEDKRLLLSACKELADMVMTLNASSGELGAGKCLQMQEIANKLLEKLHD